MNKIRPIAILLFAGFRSFLFAASGQLTIFAWENDRIAHRMYGKASEGWAGFGWDKSGQVVDFEAWKTYVDRLAQGMQTPIQVSVSAE